MRRFFLISLLFVAAPIAAQDTGTLITRSDDGRALVTRNIEVARDLQKLSRCLAKNRAKETAAFIEAGDAASFDNDRMAGGYAGFMRIMVKGCGAMLAGADGVDKYVSLPPQDFRYHVLEAAYFVSRPDPAIPSKLERTPDQRPFVSSDGALKQVQALAKLSDCISTNSPAQADALLRTVPSSKEERAAANAMAPAFSACLEDGFQLTLTPTAIRRLAADGMYWTSGGRTMGVAAGSAANAEQTK